MAAVLAALGSLIGVWFGAVLTEGRSMRERVWVRKADAYASVFEALDVMGRFLARALDDEMLRRDPPADEVERRQAAFASAREQLLRSIARQSWLLPDAVGARIERLERVLSARYDSYFDDVDASNHECAQAAGDLRALARDDMTMRRRWWARLPLGRQKLQASWKALT